MKHRALEQLLLENWDGFKPVVSKITNFRTASFVDTSKEKASVNQSLLLELYDRYCLSWRVASVAELCKKKDEALLNEHENQKIDASKSGKGSNQYFLLNDFFRLGRFRLPVSLLEFKLEPTIMLRWRIRKREIAETRKRLEAKRNSKTKGLLEITQLAAASVKEETPRMLHEAKGEIALPGTKGNIFCEGVLLAGNSCLGCEVERDSFDCEMNIYRENSFSLRDRLEIIANDFYAPDVKSTDSAVDVFPQRRTSSDVKDNMTVVMLEAAPGLGKTHAINDLICTILKSSNFEVFLAGGDPFESTADVAPFSIFNTILHQLFILREDKKNANNAGLFQSGNTRERKGRSSVYASKLDDFLSGLRFTFKRL